MWLLSNIHLIKSEDDRTWLIEFLVDKRVNYNALSFKNHHQLVTALKGFWNNPLFGIKISRDFVLDIENDLIDYCRGINVESLITILNIYSKSKNRVVMNLDLFDAVSMSLSNQIHSLTFPQ